MTTGVFVAVMCAAILHAVWNALVKGGVDKHLGMAAVIMGHVPLALAALPFVPLPGLASLPWLIAGIFLHIGYQIFLLSAYRIGDLTQVYPIARGVAPLIVAAVSVLFIGVHLKQMELMAIGVIAAGIMSLSLVRQRNGQRNHAAAVMALGTGCFIAGYSLVDGTGARITGSVLGYYGWLTIGNALGFAAWLAVTRPGVLRRIPGEALPVFLIGGSASFLAYTLVIWGFTQAPIALVTALRETSIVFALLIGVFFLGERLDLVKVFSTAVTLCGAVLLRASR